MKIRICILIFITCMMMAPILIFADELEVSIENETIGMNIAKQFISSDWYTTFEREVIETHDLKTAMKNAEESGVEKEKVIFASLYLLESNSELKSDMFGGYEHSRR